MASSDRAPAVVFYGEGDKAEGSFEGGPTGVWMRDGTPVRKEAQA